jgi:hypothetical protein
VLGPLLFALYVNDFGRVLKCCKYILYADDLLIYMHSNPKDLSQSIGVVNEDVNRILNWSKEIELKINPKKTTAMIMGTARYVGGAPLDSLPRISVDGEYVPFCSSVKYLGLSISSTLSWDTQVAKMSARVNATLHQLKLYKHLMPRSLRIRLVSTLIFPIFDYCCAAFTNITGEQDLRLQRAFNSCMRYIFPIAWDEHVTPYFHDLRWLKVKARRMFFVGCLTFRILSARAPELLFLALKSRQNMRLHGTRAQDDLLMPPLCRTEFFKRSFCSFAAEFWNGIPRGIRCAASLRDFKSQLHDYLLRSIDDS